MVFLFNAVINVGRILNLVVLVVVLVWRVDGHLLLGRLLRNLLRTHHVVRVSHRLLVFHDSRDLILGTLQEPVYLTLALVLNGVITSVLRRLTSAACVGTSVSRTTLSVVRLACSASSYLHSGLTHVRLLTRCSYLFATSFALDFDVLTLDVLKVLLIIVGGVVAHLFLVKVKRSLLLMISLVVI